MSYLANYTLAELQQELKEDQELAFFWAGKNRPAVAARFAQQAKAIKAEIRNRELADSGPILCGQFGPG